MEVSFVALSLYVLFLSFVADMVIIPAEATVETKRTANHAITLFLIKNSSLCKFLEIRKFHKFSIFYVGQHIFHLSLL